MTRSTRGMTKRQMAIELVRRWGWSGTPKGARAVKNLMKVCGWLDLSNLLEEERAKAPDNG